ncbi:hypothetical protein Q8A67_023284 [Cirrhinus molitorella]|uniref:Uncharacterized protein n=1 Tax=Cirrhinus molitorella TaxID=172907 RepID=A0AA88TCG3_9TELE|nr:hypothetical protein Q8A67_023284 [Cirrhinus molitorella]
MGGDLVGCTLSVSGCVCVDAARAPQVAERNGTGGEASHILCKSQCISLGMTNSDVSLPRIWAPAFQPLLTGTSDL